MSTSWSARSRPDIEELREHTQKERVRGLLRSAGAEGLCSLFGYSIGIPNIRNRVGELRDDDGLVIDTIRCDPRKYHRGENAPAHVRWIYRWNGTPGQLQLLRGR